MSIIPKSKNLSQARIRNGYSLRDLAAKSKVHYSTISNLENGRTSVTPKTAKAICDTLNKEFDELFEIVERRRDEHEKIEKN